MAVLTRRLPLLSLLPVAAAVAACDVDVTLRPEEDTMALGRQAQNATTWAPTEQEQVTIRLEMDSVVEYKQQVPIRITVHNGSGQPLSIGFGRQDAFQVLIAHAEGRADTAAIWSPGPTRNVSSEIVTDPLRPGQDTVFQVIWPTQDDFGHFAPPGRYRVRAYVAAQLLRANRIWTEWQGVRVRAAE